MARNLIVGLLKNITNFSKNPKAVIAGLVPVIQALWLIRRIDYRNKSGNDVEFVFQLGCGFKRPTAPNRTYSWSQAPHFAAGFFAGPALALSCGSALCGAFQRLAFRRLIMACRIIVRGGAD